MRKKRWRSGVSFVSLSISYRPWPSQKTESLWLFYFDTPNIHNMFRLTPWSHGIWFSTDKNIQRSQETGPNFHFLSEKLIESESREKVSFKTSSPQGSPFCPTFPLLLCPRTPPCWNYSSNFHWSKDTSFQLGLSTTQPLWLALRTGWFLVEICKGSRLWRTSAATRAWWFVALISRRCAEPCQRRSGWPAWRCTPGTSGL